MLCSGRTFPTFSPPRRRQRSACAAAGRGRPGGSFPPKMRRFYCGNFCWQIARGGRRKCWASSYTSLVVVRTCPRSPNGARLTSHEIVFVVDPLYFVLTALQLKSTALITCAGGQSPIKAGTNGPAGRLSGNALDNCPAGDILQPSIMTDGRTHYAVLKDPRRTQHIVPGKCSE